MVKATWSAWLFAATKLEEGTFWAEAVIPPSYELGLLISGSLIPWFFAGSNGSLLSLAYIYAEEPPTRSVLKPFTKPSL
jgi:hypothetical protein